MHEKYFGNEENILKPRKNVKQKLIARNARKVNVLQIFKTLFM